MLQRKVRFNGTVCDKAIDNRYIELVKHVVRSVMMTHNIDVSEINTVFDGDTLTWVRGDENVYFQHNLLEDVDDLISNIPINAHVTTEDISIGDSVCRDSKHDAWWSCEECSVMDGKYLVLPFEIDINDRLSEFVKLCSHAIHARDDCYVYHVADMSIADILSINKHVALLTSLFLRFSPDARYDLIDHTLDMWSDIEGDITMGDYRSLSMEQALSIRCKLSSERIPSLITQDFDGTYIVFVAVEEGATTNLNTLLPLPKVECHDIDSLRLGWTSNDEWVGFM